MTEELVKIVHRLAEIIPLEWYVVVGSILEEIIAPIPSPVVMTSAGSLAASLEKPLIYLGLLAVLAAIGKTAGAYVFYILADKAEDVLLGRFGKYLGLSHKSVEHIGKHFNGSRRDDVILFILRALPIIPSAPLSLLSGVIKLNKKTFLVSTFFGNIVRSIFFLYLGYAGIATLTHGLESMESIITVVIALIIAAIVAYAYIHRRKLKKNTDTQ